MKIDTFRELVNLQEESLLSKGDTVNKPYRSLLSVNTLGSEGSYTRQDVTDTNESLSIDQEKEVSFYIRDLDEIQSNYATASEYAKHAAQVLSNAIDGDVLAEAANATHTVDDADMGGTADEGITLTTSNISTLFLAASEKLDRTNSPEQGRFAVLSPQICRILKDYLVNRETAWGDKVGENGFVGMYDNFAIYKSNALYWTGVLSLVTQPTDGDTVTLNIPNALGTRTTITFTFKTTLGSTAGNVLIGGSADVARANLATLITTPGTTTANGVALTAANQALLKGVTGTNDNDADTLTVAAQGKGFIVVGETLTDATDTWTATTLLQHALFGVKGAISMAMQVRPNMLVKSRDGYIGSDIVSWNVYGIKTFADGARQLVNAEIRTDDTTLFSTS